MSAAQAGSLLSLRRWLPDTLFGRLALLLLVAVVASHVLALTLMFELRPQPGPGMRHFDERHAGAKMGGDATRAGLPPEMRQPPSMRQPPGMPPEPHPRHMLHPGLLLDIGVRLAALMLAAWIGARWLSQPIGRLARAARALGTDIRGAPLAEAGTAECREAPRVFNQMQSQICQQLDERDRFVAAVSHDLRTPLTRLRLRAESLPDDESRRRFSLDIEEMDTMIRSTLDYLRGAADAEALVQLDVQALLLSIADDQEACGHHVPVHGTALPIAAQPCALRRALGNLVENAIRYGGAAELHVIDSPTLLCIEVRDRGPGLAEAELVKVLAPFYRVEGSRNRDHGGVGLGLSIASDIVRRHGGTLKLRNGEGLGLVAMIALPRRRPGL